MHIIPVHQELAVEVRREEGERKANQGLPPLHSGVVQIRGVYLGEGAFPLRRHTAEVVAGARVAVRMTVQRRNIVCQPLLPS